MQQPHTVLYSVGWWTTVNYLCEETLTGDGGSACASVTHVSVHLFTPAASLFYVILPGYDLNIYNTSSSSGTVQVPSKII